MTRFNKRTMGMVLTIALIMSTLFTGISVYAEGEKADQSNPTETIDTADRQGNTGAAPSEDSQQQESIAPSVKQKAPLRAPKGTPTDITGANVDGISDAVYTGKAITQNITITLDGSTLLQDTDYQVVYENNINVGTAQVTITGIDAYQGSIVKEFNIAPGTPRIEYRSHVQRMGWQGWVKDGATSGTSGKGLRVEAFILKLNTAGLGGSVRYRTHVQRVGWQDWRVAGAVSGTTGKKLRVEALQIELTGAIADEYDIYYRVHVQNYGWMAWAKNGEVAGTSGLSRRAEAVQIKLYPKGTGFDIERQKNVFFMQGKNMYYRNSSGEIVKGWQNIGSSRFYFDPSTGAMRTGWQTLDGKKYYFDTCKGVMAKGWRTISGKKYYFHTSNGQMLKGWQTINGKRFYFSTSSGAMLKGWQTIGGYKYYFSTANGVMLKGWQTIGGSRYYFDSNGRYVKDAGTYIDINLRTQHLIYYKQGQIIRSDDVISGRPSMPTPAGTFSVQSGRARNIHLIGDDYDVVVDYWLPFIGSSVGMHDAYWQWEFGGDIYKYRGSHGCVNVPYSTIVYLYNNVPTGTKVIVHY